MTSNSTPRTGTGTFLFEIPGLRWSDSEARQASSRVSQAPIDILTAVSHKETWVYVPALFWADLQTCSDRTAFIAALLGVAAADIPDFRYRHLSQLLAIGDIERGHRQLWHYTSQTDIPADVEDEFNQWFDDEHLPRLAALPGTVHATRYRASEPRRYLASYDLTSQDVRGSQAWRSAIATPWRDRVHLWFVNPRRLMLKRLNLPQ